MIKPDGVQRGLVGKIIERFENRGYQLVAMKLVHAGEDHLEKHYADLKGKPFFPGLIKYMTSGPVVVQVLEGDNAVAKYREVMGATNPEQAADGTIRKQFALSIGENSVHGSDSLDNAKIEIAQFFTDDQIVG